MLTAYMTLWACKYFFFSIYNNNTLRLATELPDPELRRTLWVRAVEIVNWPLVVSLCS